jgi:hypothetical protein
MRKGSVVHMDTVRAERLQKRKGKQAPFIAEHRGILERVQSIGVRGFVAVVMIAVMLMASIGAYAQAAPRFLGVSIMEATSASMRKAAIESGAKSTFQSAKEMREDFSFPKGKLPGGITKVSFFYNGAGSLILAEAKVPMHKPWERMKEREIRYESVLETLSNKYGSPNQTREVKNEFGSYPQYTWFFEDKSAVVLKSRGAIYGESLQYINLPLYTKYKADDTKTREENV